MVCLFNCSHQVVANKQILNKIPLLSLPCRQLLISLNINANDREKVVTSTTQLEITITIHLSLLVVLPWTGPILQPLLLPFNITIWVLLIVSRLGG
jgi:hypothetical protein